MLQLFTTEVEARSTMLLGVVQIVPPDIYIYIWVEGVR